MLLAPSALGLLITRINRRKGLFSRAAGGMPKVPSNLSRIFRALETGKGWKTGGEAMARRSVTKDPGVFERLMMRAYPGKGPVVPGASEAAHERDPDFNVPEDQIINLTEVVEGEIEHDQNGGVMGPNPTDTGGEGGGAVEKGTQEKDSLEAPSGLEPEMSSGIPPAEGEDSFKEEAQSDTAVVEVGTAPGAAEDLQGDGGDRGAQDLHVEELLGAFFALDEAGDLLDELPGVSEPDPLAPPEEAPGIESAVLKELDKGGESTAQTVVKETDGLIVPVPKPAPSARSEGIDWVAGDGFYPKCVHNLEEEVTRCQEEMERRIGELRAQKEELKKRYQDVRSLLYATDDQLKTAVVNVFRTYWQFQVSDVENTKSLGFTGDILVEQDGRKFLFKIKSTNRTYPPVKYIAQLWRELHFSGLGSEAKGGLILNHDVRIDPRYRNLAYTGDDEESLEDIIFLDTRVLFDLTLAIIEYDFPLREAKELVLKEGRVKFHLDEVAS